MWQQARCKKATLSQAVAVRGRGIAAMGLPPAIDPISSSQLAVVNKPGTPATSNQRSMHVLHEPTYILDAQVSLPEWLRGWT